MCENKIEKVEIVIVKHPVFHEVLVKNKPLVQAVHDNDLNRLKALVEAGESVNEKSCSQGPVLNCVIKYGRTEMFDYLMTLDDLRLDVVDGDDLSPLLCAIQWFNEHFVLELIKKGADIHEINSGGETVLHMAARFRSDNLRVGKLFIEAGVDVNRQNCWGRTALFNACRAGNVDWIYMLLYYGACATIPSVEGFLPVVVLSSRTPLTEREQVQEILFNHTFEVGDTVKLSNLIVAMCLDRALFSNIVNVTSNVTFDLGDLTLLNYQLQYLKIKHLRVFVEKFGIIVKELINNCKPLVALAKDGADAELLEILYIFLESEHGVDFVQECGSRNFLIHNLVGGSGKPTITEEEMIKIICLILTYGLDISSRDLDTIYYYYGCSELFKILLHMDVQMIDEDKIKYEMGVLYYNPNVQIEVFFNKYSVSTDLLSYYNHPQLKEICLSESVTEEIKAKARTLPEVPCLIELSRNVARKHIIHKYNIRNSMQFYTVLKWLPIGEMTKNIIALQQKLY